MPAPGHLLLAVDYSFIELRTLAAVCEARYGFSRLAETIRAGIDPHCYTAAMLLGLTLDGFMALADVVDEVEVEGVEKRIKGHWFKRHRQIAKPINFGVPGGLRAGAWSTYARNTYGVEMTLEQAEAFRTRLIKEIYPELSRSTWPTTRWRSWPATSRPARRIAGRRSPRGAHARASSRGASRTSSAGRRRRPTARPTTSAGSATPGRRSRT